MGDNSIYQIGVPQGLNEDKIGKVLTVDLACSNVEYLLSAFISINLV